MRKSWLDCGAASAPRRNPQAQIRSSGTRTLCFEPLETRQMFNISTGSTDVIVGPVDATESSATTSAQVWTNPTQPLDVNDDGAVTALDALLVINAINQWSVGPLTRLVGQTTSYLDVNGDGILSPTDVLTIIDQLNQVVSTPVQVAPVGPLGQPPDNSTGAASAIPFNGSNQVATQSAYQITFGDTYLPVDVTQSYQLSAWARSGDGQGGAYDPDNLQYFGFAAYDVDKNQITALDVSKVAGAEDTYLAQPLNPGDTQIVLEDATGWYDGDDAEMRSLAWYGYQDSTGHTYADFTYTRNVAYNAWSAGAISGNVITLSSPWAGPALAAGAAIRNTTDGATYSYAVLNDAAVPADQWMYYSATIGDVEQDGALNFAQFPPGTAFVRPVILSNFHGLADNQVTWLDVNWSALSSAPLAGTSAFTLTGDTASIANQMVSGINQYLTNALAAAPATAAANFQLDFSSLAAYQSGLQSERDSLATDLGVIDPRVSGSNVVMTGADDPSDLVAETPDYQIYAVSWPVLDGVTGQGLLLEPDQAPVASVVAIPDADWTPEMLAGLAPGVEPQAQYARRLAENGVQVLVPTLIDRSTDGSGNAALGISTNESHREFIYRMAYEVGRTIQGYEIEKIESAIDWLSRDSSQPPVGIYGYGEGSLLALYTAALDPRVKAVVVSGMSGSLSDIPNEPIYRNAWGLLEQFGLPQLAEMIAPNALILDASSGPEVTDPGTDGQAAPGRLLALAPQQQLEDFQSDLSAGQSQLNQVTQLVGHAWLSLYGDSYLPGSDSTLTALVSSLTGRAISLVPSGAAPQDLRVGFDPVARQMEQFNELVTYSQNLISDSANERQQNFWSQLDYSSTTDYQASTDALRQELWDNVIGRLPDPTLPMDAQTRLIYNEPNWLGYEVELSVFPDVFAYGILLVPKGLQSGEQLPVVVCQGGLDSLATDVTDPSEESAIYNSYGAQLADRGYVVFSPQAPLVGDDTFRQLQRLANPLGLSLYSFIIAQNQQILAFLQSQSYVDSSRIAYYGMSYGGAAAMIVPAILTGYSMSISSGAFTDLITKTVGINYDDSYLFTDEYEQFQFNMANTFSDAELAALIAPRPFMVEHGNLDPTSTDAMVASEYAKVTELYTRLGEPAQTAIDYFNGGHEVYGVQTFAFLDDNLDWPGDGGSSLDLATYLHFPSDA
jgi:dienelactone hydrolase